MDCARQKSWISTPEETYSFFNAEVYAFDFLLAASDCKQSKEMLLRVCALCQLCVFTILQASPIWIMNANPNTNLDYNPYNQISTYYIKYGNMKNEICTCIMNSALWRRHSSLQKKNRSVLIHVQGESLVLFFRKSHGRIKKIKKKEGRSKATRAILRPHERFFKMVVRRNI